ncbi:MAG: DUF5711 family protein [Firmicutes bacterium]|nr:DUF5711 family protein [Bacillota bacterium]
MKIRKVFIYIVIIIIVFSLFLWIRNSDLALADKKVKRLKVLSQVSPASNNSIVLCDNGILIEGEGFNIKARGIDGKNLWSFQLESTIKDIKVCGSDFLIITEKNHIFVISKSGKKLWQYDMPYTPASVISDGGKYFVIQYNWQEHNTFEIFSTEGIKSCDGIIDKAHIISFSTSSDKYFTLSLLDVSLEKVLSKVATYNVKGEIEWAVNYDSILVPKLKYVSKDSIIIISEDSAKKYNLKGNLLKEISLAKTISNIAISKSLLVIITKENNYYEIYTYDMNLNQLGTSAVSDGIDGIFAASDEYILFNEDSLTVANKHGRITELFESSFDINSAYIYDDSVYVISNRKLIKLTN